MLIRTKNKSDMANKLTMLTFLTWLSSIHCSVLVPTYVLPPASFNQQRDQRSLPSVQQQGVRTLARLAGGHLRLPSQNYTSKNTIFADHSKNNFAYVEKDTKGYDDKFAGVVVKTENQNVGWNQGQWDDGMLMSSAGNGKEKNKQKQQSDDSDEDKKTLADQVAEGKYGLIQKELFSKTPTRPGVISYTINPETKTKDNESNMGGLKSDEIWLAEDHLLVLKGGSYPDHNAKPSENAATWPPIDAYQAPPRQVKIPQNPEVPPPFPVRLSDNGPLVFLTPNGSIPAPLFPARPPGAGFGAFPSSPFPYPPAAPSSAQSPYPGNITPGGTPFPIAPFPFFPPRNESELPFKFPGSINGSFPGNLPPGASFLPPPGNLSDLYDEDDPSIYYPPPYSFSYQAENTSKVPAGPLVPGIVLPPPPDFFAPLNPPTTTVKSTAHVYPPTPLPPATVMKPHNANKYLPPGGNKHRVILPENVDNTIDTTSTPTPKSVTSSSRPVHKPKVVNVSKPVPTRVTQTTPPVTTIKSHKTEKTPLVAVIQKPIKTTLKPVNVYYPEQNYYDENSITPSPQPFLIYGPPSNGRLPLNQYPDKTFVTSTPVPLRAYYSNEDENLVPQIQYTKQNIPTVSRVRPEFIQSTKQNGKSVASFYFYEEPISKVPTTTPQTIEYFDGRNYYQTIKNNDVENGFNPTNIDFRPIPSREPSPFFFIPQRQGSRTLTQEYFSVQKPSIQNNYIPQAVLPQQGRPDSFYEQIASIQQTIDYYTTRRPKLNVYQPNPYREPRQKLKPTPRPVYQFSYQNNNARPEQQQQNRFRAPQMDSEPFRPMVTYSVPFNTDSDYQSTPKSVFATEQKVTTETIQPTKYYTTANPNDYDYEDAKQDKKNVVKSTVKGSVTSRPNLVTPSPKPRKSKHNNPTTKNPIDHAYYTKHEETLFDDITKNYFNIFGQKIENAGHEINIGVTAPIKHIEVTTASTPLKYQNENAQNLRLDQQSIISLASDTQVNFRQPRPLVDPESEFIPIVNPEIQAKYEAEQKRIKEQIPQKQKVKNVEIINPDYIKEGQQFANDQIDILRPQNQYQYVQQVQSNVRYNNNNSNNNNNKDSGRGRYQVAEGRPGSLVTYRLPGEGAHVYFLTPQPVRHEFRTASEIEALS